MLPGQSAWQCGLSRPWPPTCLLRALPWTRDSACFITLISIRRTGVSFLGARASSRSGRAHGRSGRDLFSEFHRLGVLEGQFFENDKKFLDRNKRDPDGGVRDRFNAALDHAQGLASARLAVNLKDRDALFAMTLSSGLRADYAALIEKKNMASLHYTREANDWADQLLAVDPNCYDARVATGLAST